MVVACLVIGLILRVPCLSDSPLYGITTTQYYSCSQTHLCPVGRPLAVVTCGFLESPGNGTKNGSSPLAGSVVKFSCNDGFILDGSAQRTCTEAGTWDGVDTKCIGELLSLLRPLVSLKVLRVEAWLAGNGNRADAHVYCAFSTNNV